MMQTFKKMVSNKVRIITADSILIYVMLLFLPSILVATKHTNVRYISPLPESKYLSPFTNIIIKTAGRLNLSMLNDTSFLSVSGSKSGKHTGQLSISEDESAFFFVPEYPFTTGERVTVQTTRRLLTREGFVIEPLRFQFEIGQSTSSSNQSMKITNYTSHKISFDRITYNDHSHFGLFPKSNDFPVSFPLPIILQNVNPATGSIFIGTYKTGKPGYHLQYVTYIKSNQQYIMVLNNKGLPINWQEVADMNTDFKLQPNGHLTYYDFSFGYYLELDSVLDIIDYYKCGNGYQTNSHELRLLANGHALLLGDDRQFVDMSKFVPGGNPNASVLGMVIQELDQQKRVVFQWRSFDHFSITDATHEELTSDNIDYVHPNAIDLDSDGNILLSSRHLDEITKINRTNGDIIWRWGGKMNQFKFVNDTLRFSHQHSIRLTPTGTYILFDNGNYRENEYSRAVEYVLDQEKKTATLVWEYRHKPDIFSISMGSIQRLSNGNTFIGWGSASQAFTEVHPDGSVALDAKFPDSIVTYRAFKYDWPQASSQTVVKDESSAPANFLLEQNYPNPFNPSTTISYSLAKASEVTITVFDILCRRTAILFNGMKPAGKYSLVFDGSALASGFYICKMQAGDFTQTRKLLLLK